MIRFTVRAAVAAAIALMVSLVGFGTAQAKPATVDLDAIALSIEENGYYVDPSSEYLSKDADLDNLRSAINGPSPVFAVVLPDSVQPGPVLEELPKLVGRPASYVVLAGDDFAAVSNVLPADRVSAASDDAAAKNPGRPDLATLQLLRTLATDGPAEAQLPPAGANLPSLVETQNPAAGPESGFPWLTTIAAAVAVIILVAVGFTLRRRRTRSVDGARQPVAVGSGPRRRASSSGQGRHSARPAPERRPAADTLPPPPEPGRPRGKSRRPDY